MTATSQDRLEAALDAAVAAAERGLEVGLDPKTPREERRRALERFRSALDSMADLVAIERVMAKHPDVPVETLVRLLRDEPVS